MAEREGDPGCVHIPNTACTYLSLTQARSLCVYLCAFVCMCVCARLCVFVGCVSSCVCWGVGDPAAALSPSTLTPWACLSNTHTISTVGIGACWSQNGASGRVAHGSTWVKH